MPRWDISLHPSWDRMYAAGMTVQEIADYTHRARSTVHRHLQVRETYSTDLRAVHEAALAARDPDWPNTHWRHNYKAVQDFHRPTADYPKPTTKQIKRHLRGGSPGSAHSTTEANCQPSKSRS